MMTYGSSHKRYGRSPHQEMLDDMREELLKAKKANAQLALDNRLLSTRLQRLIREVRTYSSSAHAKVKHNAEHVTTQTNTCSNLSQPSEMSPHRKAAKMKQMNSSAEPAEDKVKVGIGSSGYAETVPEKSLLSNQIRVLHEKNKKKLRVAKAYAEQNRKLKERLKQMREEFHELKKNPVKNHSGVTSPSLHLNGLEGQLAELISKLEREQLRNAEDGFTVGEVEAAFENSSKSQQENSADCETNSVQPCRNDELRSICVEEEVPSDVLLYVISELATAHSERQIVSKKMGNVDALVSHM